MSLSLKFETLPQALYFEAKTAAPTRGVTFIDGKGKERRVPYLEALEEAYKRARALQRLGVEPREPGICLLDTSPEFLFTFFGLMLAGAIPCPLSPPVSFADLNDVVTRVGGVARSLGATRVITAEGMAPLSEQGGQGTKVILERDLLAQDPGGAFEPVAVAGDDCAFLQCTSGSTGLSKGVELSHENLISNIYQIGWCLDVREEDVVVSWLPLYHDMGLIGCLLFSIYWNLGAVLMSPYRFLRRPWTWLQAVSQHGGTITTAPNFAYGYVTERVKDKHLEGLSLESWRVALCGAEPIQPRVLRAFQERFRGSGLRDHVVAPCYGLAEATLAVTFHELETPLRTEWVDRHRLAAGEVSDTDPESEDAVEVVSCGRPMPETRVRILGPDGEELPDDRVGRVHVSGPTVMRGYRQRPELTQAVLSTDGWLDTGDVGYLREGGLRVTGRAKDVIILRGSNYLPSEFEWAAEKVEGVRRGNVVAFGVLDPKQGTEVLVVVCESDLKTGPQRAELEEAVARAVGGATGVRPHTVVLAPRGTVKKTSSGKVRRASIKQSYLEQLRAEGGAGAVEGPAG
jgi:acyl-CoA synthetase (AMP-forming)/AMP-acid ligase II